MPKYKNIIILVVSSLVLFAASWGCRGKLPSMSSMAQPIAKVPDYVIDNFEDGNTIFNTSLRGASAGTWTNYGTSGQSTVNSASYVLANTLADTLNPTGMAAHVLGSLTDPANGSYPEVTLQGRFNKAPYYDASSFTGLKYLILIGSTDTATKRRFKITIAKTVPISNGGVCETNCWDHFGINMPAAPTGTWVSQAVTFATATREGWGSPITPATFTGTNLQELIGLDWAESRNNMGGTSVIDFWVDEVEFF